MQSFIENITANGTGVSAPVGLPHEIVCFKQAPHSRPVFWIHAAAGGSSIGQYQRLSNVSQRTFYAIRPPRIDITGYWLWGVEARASYYIAIIKSIDPSGPYDLGGYSMGSTIAYEVARQLVAMGHRVSSLVLIDPTDMACVRQWAAAHNSSDTGVKSLLLRTLNFSLLSDSWSEGLEPPVNFIHRDELEAYHSLDQWIESIIHVGHQRGLKLTRDQFILRVIQDHQLLESLVCYGYEQSLSEQHGIEGYVLINRSHSMQGSCAPYILMDDSLALSVEKNYNAEWLRKCQDFTRVELNCTTHFMLLFEPDAWVPCIDLCRRLYRLD